VNDQAWEREHRHPTPVQTEAIGIRRRVAEAKLDRDQVQAKRKAQIDPRHWWGTAAFGPDWSVGPIAAGR